MAKSLRHQMKIRKEFKPKNSVKEEKSLCYIVKGTEMLTT
jgi:hypothetical protein